MFEIKNENSAGIFHLKLNRTLSSKEILEVAQIAANLVQEANKSIGTITTAENTNTFIGQSKLGEKPVDKINMGSYVEPNVGVRIRMLSFPEENKMASIKAFGAITGISLVGSKDIIYGNFPSPIFTKEIADKIIEVFKANNIYAGIIGGQCKAEVVE